MKTLLKFGLIPLLLHGLAIHGALTATNVATGCLALHSMFVESDGSLWTMGYGEYGELGYGAGGITNRPQLIVANGVTAVAAGMYHSLFLKTDGSLRVMGWDGMGQLGDNNDSYFWTNRPELLISNGVTSIAAGAYHSLFLKADGSLWAMGFNTSGQLGDGSSASHVNYPEEVVPSGVTTIAGGAYC